MSTMMYDLTIIGLLLLVMAASVIGLWWSYRLGRRHGDARVRETTAQFLGRVPTRMKP